MFNYIAAANLFQYIAAANLFQYIAAANLFLDCRKEAWVAMIVDDVIKLAHIVCMFFLFFKTARAIKQNEGPCLVLHAL